MGKIEYLENGTINGSVRGAQISQTCLDLILQEDCQILAQVLRDRKYAKVFHEAVRIFTCQRWKKESK